jgi:hypothetical protein
VVVGASADSHGFERESLEASYRRHQLETPFGDRLNAPDFKRDPRPIWRIDWTSEISAADAFGSDFDFRRHIVTGRTRLRLSKYQTFGARAIRGWSGGVLPPQRIFAIGGIGSVHGYDFKEATGDTLSLLNLEYELGWQGGLKAIGFFDAGRVHPLTDTPSPWLKRRLGHRPRRHAHRLRIPHRRHPGLAQRAAALRSDVLSRPADCLGHGSRDRRERHGTLMIGCRVFRQCRVFRGTVAAVVCVLLLGTPVAALEVQVKSLHAPASAVTTTIELREVLPDRFKKTLDAGGILHLRVQAELWESRPVWDRLVYPAIVRVFRFKRAAPDGLSVTDPSGVTTTFAATPASVPVTVDLGDTNRLTPAEKYYVHVIATIGTLAEREVDEVGDAVFGRASESNGLGSLGRLMFRTVLQVSDYLQSVSAEARTRKTPGADIIKRASP